MLADNVDHKELYQLNTYFVNSCMTIDENVYQKIRSYNKSILSHINQFYNLYLHSIPIEHCHNSILEHITSYSSNDYCRKFAKYATFDDLTSLVANYGADQVWFTQYLSALATKAPENAAIEIYKNLYDEIGHASDDSNNYFEFHPNIYRRLYNLYNMPIFDRLDIDANLLDTTFACINIFILSTKLDYLTGAGALFVLEKTIPTQLSYILERLKALDVSHHDREFFEIHTTLDIEHSERWWKFCIQPYMASQADINQLLLGINLGIYARNLLWHGLYSASSFKTI